VTLVQLQMEGLRPFAGWSDPALTHFEGPEITEVRALGCEACGASNAVRAPGQTQHLACAYCGSVLAIDGTDAAIGAELLDRRDQPGFKPPIPLGARGKLGGVEWQVIGAMVRSTWADGQEWSWTELALFNPYRGFAWLVQDTQYHWSYVEPVRGALPTAHERSCRWRNRAFRLFQRGEARVKHVLGEFTWEVAVGDQAFTADYVDPPNMLSLERTDDEVSWSLGAWLSADEVRRAFRASVSAAGGVAPHQPNPHKSPARIASVTLRGLALVAVALVLLVVAFVLPRSTPLVGHEYLVVAGENAWVTSPVTLAEESIVRVALDASALPSSPDVVVSLLNAETGEVWDWTAYGADSARARLGPGTWNGRVALPVAAPDTDAGKSLRVDIEDDPGWAFPALLLFLFSLLAPLLYALDVSSFETRRWQNSDVG
jgi:hypothetical protein